MREGYHGQHSNVANDEAYRSAGEPRIGHQPHDNAPLSAERGDARGRIEHLRHSRRAARTLVAHNDHVIQTGADSWFFILKEGVRNNVKGGFCEFTFKRRLT